MTSAALIAKPPLQANSPRETRCVISILCYRTLDGDRPQRATERACFGSQASSSTSSTSFLPNSPPEALRSATASSNAARRENFSSDFNFSRHIRPHPRSVAIFHPLSLPSSNFFIFSHLIYGRAVCCKVLERYRQHPISNFTNGDSPIGYFTAVFAPEDSAFFGELGNLGGISSGVRLDYILNDY